MESEARKIRLSATSTIRRVWPFFFMVSFVSLGKMSLKSIVWRVVGGTWVKGRWFESGLGQEWRRCLRDFQLAEFFEAAGATRTVFTVVQELHHSSICESSDHSEEQL